jgi:hypothetical protein
MAMGLPISVGGWGPREGVAAVSFWMAGLTAPLGVTVASRTASSRSSRAFPARSSC